MSRSKRIASAAGAEGCGQIATVRPQAMIARRRVILRRGIAERQKIGARRKVVTPPCGLLNGISFIAEPLAVGYLSCGLRCFGFARVTRTGSQADIRRGLFVEVGRMDGNDTSSAPTPPSYGSRSILSAAPIAHVIGLSDSGKRNRVSGTAESRLGQDRKDAQGSRVNRTRPVRPTLAEVPLADLFSAMFGALVESRLDSPAGQLCGRLTAG